MQKTRLLDGRAQNRTISDGTICPHPKTRLLDGRAQNRTISDGTARPHPKTRLLDGREAEVFFPEQGVVCKQGAQPRIAAAAGRRRLGHPQIAEPQEPAGEHLGPVVVIISVETGERRVPVGPHGRRAGPDAEKEVA